MFVCLCTHRGGSQGLKGSAKAKAQENYTDLGFILRESWALEPMTQSGLVLCELEIVQGSRKGWKLGLPSLKGEKMRREASCKQV